MQALRRDRLKLHLERALDHAESTRKLLDRICEDDRLTQEYLLNVVSPALRGSIAYIEMYIKACLRDLNERG